MCRGVTVMVVVDVMIAAVRAKFVSLDFMWRIPGVGLKPWIRVA